MKREDYEEALKENSKQRVKIHAQFAESNCPFKIGDRLEDHYQTIRVESRSLACYGNGAYGLDGVGPLLTKSGKPFKSDKQGRVCFVNIKKINGLPVQGYGPC